MSAVGQLDFEDPDYERFPCLRLAGESFSKGGTAPTILNAANEIAVQGFLDRRLRFTQIAQLVEYALEKVPSVEVSDLDDILESDAEARDVVKARLEVVAL
jgi:1-deoxy-D-xylulose-5-phosphate reductoisomerase